MEGEGGGEGGGGELGGGCGEGEGWVIGLWIGLDWYVNRGEESRDGMAEDDDLGGRGGEGRERGGSDGRGWGG